MLTHVKKFPCLTFYRHRHTKRSVLVLVREVGDQLLLFKEKNSVHANITDSVEREALPQYMRGKDEPEHLCKIISLGGSQYSSAPQIPACQCTGLHFTVSRGLKNRVHCTLSEWTARLDCSSWLSWIRSIVPSANAIIQNERQKKLAAANFGSLWTNRRKWIT